MFGLGFGELIVIAIVALLFLGPDKLPEAAKTLSKGIRDFRKQTRELQQTIESDEEIGGAIRDLKSALRGDDIGPRAPPVRKPPADGVKVTTPRVSATPPAAADAPLAKPIDEIASDGLDETPAGMSPDVPGSGPGGGENRPTVQIGVPEIRPGSAIAKSDPAEADAPSRTASGELSAVTPGERVEPDADHPGGVDTPPAAGPEPGAKRGEVRG